MKTLLFLPIVALLCSSYCHAQDTPSITKERDPWSGFAMGSWVVIQKDQSKGEQSRTSTEKRVKIPDRNSFALEVYKAQDGKFNERRSGVIHHLRGFDPSQSRQFQKPTIEKATLTIAGKEYLCRLETYNLTKEASAKGKQKTVKLWKSDAVNLPYRVLPTTGADLALGKNVLKAYYKIKHSRGSEEIKHEVVQLNVKETLNGKEINCVLEQSEMTQIRLSEKDGVPQERTLSGTAKRWITHDIPGNFLKHESAATRKSEGTKTHFKATKKVTDFGILKPNKK